LLGTFVPGSAASPRFLEIKGFFDSEQQFGALSSNKFPLVVIV
jgi:hypothetical protein